MKLRLASPADAAAIATIYAPYVTSSAASFEMVPPDPSEMQVRMADGGGLYPWLVALGEDGESIIAYAYAARFRPRPAYRYAVETSVYVDPPYQGRGAGRALYDALLELLERQRFTQAIAGITLPNDASVRLHESRGFKAAGTYRQVGYKGGRWLDVGLWQRALAPATNPPTEPIPYAELV